MAPCRVIVRALWTPRNATRNAYSVRILVLSCFIMPARSPMLVYAPGPHAIVPNSESAERMSIEVVRLKSPVEDTL